LPKIIKKVPFSSPIIIYIDAKTLPDMYQELGIYAAYTSLGRGLLLVMQTQVDYDEPNFLFEGNCIMGSAYIVRYRANGISDVIEDDIVIFTDQITLIGEV